MSGRTDPVPMPALRIELGGRVQGVGFRPFVYRLARRHGVSGWVRNGLGTVEILAAADPAILDRFTAALLAEAPPTARPGLLGVTPVAEAVEPGFSIRDSAATEGARPAFPPDLAPCPDCLRELADRSDRRAGYPFINCTQCGPRYSLIRRLPYDRANTAMAGFPLCPACRAEYADPLNRRFHAEPVACPDCGPHCRFEAAGAPSAAGEAALAAGLAALRRGLIVAVRGVGGYHLLCDAADQAAVAALRHRKSRPDKPFAVLFPDDARTLDSCVAADAAARAALRGPARPILLLPRRPGAPLAPAIAPGFGTIGAMLADSPLHHLLAEGFGAPLVATSANRSGEPMLTDPDAAAAALAGIADAFLHHDRPIERPVDDSVLRIIDGAPRILRAGRGLCPIERALPFRLAEPVLALGGHMKSTIALGFADRVVISPHLGDLDDPAALAGLARMAADLQSLYGIAPRRLLVDAHPGYASTRWARAEARARGLDIVPVWHHHAHASALAGEMAPGAAPLLVLTWDGVGLGPDGTLWGGEALLGRPGAWRRVARFRPFRLQGGDAASRAPWRSAAALCWAAGIDPPAGLLPEEGAALARAAWARELNCHRTGAAGRLFDAAAALLGLCRVASFEGQGPALLESLADTADDITGPAPGLPLADAADGVIEADWSAALPALLDASVPAARRAAAFHATMAATALAIAETVRRRHGVAAIGLAGGVFQNRNLVERLAPALRAAGFATLFGEAIACNDAGLSFGQIIEYGGRA